jgi:redox-sensitive bicupin YhaK (pirin superfamily)
LQLWLALPDEDEEIDTALHHHPSADTPVVNVIGVTLLVIIVLLQAYERAVYTAQDSLKAHLPSYLPE